LRPSLLRLGLAASLLGAGLQSFKLKKTLPAFIANMQIKPILLVGYLHPMDRLEAHIQKSTAFTAW